ncbi:uncharacterized protein AMSG_08849 [Thecamonas trahens ATCC 50062]|uniref:Uncharacterized protein n=1 Tax=Thecamonas trahens ATCC 50062 TaxID=461836 RepID=A0A0L0DM09_THETB|nr:hypothetical protein AMSG_08849 [Thecamonas trahens ATCC 50062]KNC53347.1 hypothetical protein AMSG_08849 [Thecamonas trahens ATCC 50062]|eukprot:XP_013754395.1 hypothetical protein AMSG_08849 [Thecamonas trahens ATCC 50062]
MVYFVFFSTRVLAKLAASIISTFLLPKDESISIGSLNIALFGGRIILRKVRYVTRDASFNFVDAPGDLMYNWASRYDAIEEILRKREAATAAASAATADHGPRASSRSFVSDDADDSSCSTGKGGSRSSTHTASAAGAATLGGAGADGYVAPGGNQIPTLFRLFPMLGVKVRKGALYVGNPQLPNVALLHWHKATGVLTAERARSPLDYYKSISHFKLVRAALKLVPNLDYTPPSDMGSAKTPAARSRVSRILPRGFIQRNIRNLREFVGDVKFAFLREDEAFFDDDLAVSSEYSDDDAWGNFIHSRFNPFKRSRADGAPTSGPPPGGLAVDVSCADSLAGPDAKPVADSGDEPHPRPPAPRVRRGHARRHSRSASRSEQDYGQLVSPANYGLGGTAIGLSAASTPASSRPAARAHARMRSRLTRNRSSRSIDRASSTAPLQPGPTGSSTVPDAGVQAQSDKLLFPDSACYLDSEEYGRVDTILSCSSVTLTYFADVVGTVPPSPSPDDLGPQWGMDLIFADLVVAYGPFAERQRALMLAYFMPFPYEDWEVWPIVPGTDRYPPDFTTLVKFSNEATLRIPFRHALAPPGAPLPPFAARRVGSLDIVFAHAPPEHASAPPLGSAAMSTHKQALLRPGSSLFFNMPMLILDNAGYTMTYELNLFDVRVATSLNGAPLLTAPAISLSVEGIYPLPWNGEQLWSLYLSATSPSIFYLAQHSTFFGELGADFGAGEPYDLAHYVPYVWNYDVRFTDFRLYTNVNEKNIIDVPNDLASNAHYVFSGPRLDLTVATPYLEYEPPFTIMTFGCTAPSLSLSLLLQSDNTIRASILDSARTLQSSQTFVSTARALDSFHVDLHASSLDALGYGFFLRYLGFLSDNYFGYSTVFRSTNEYTATLGQPEATGAGDHAPPPPPAAAAAPVAAHSRAASTVSGASLPPYYDEERALFGPDRLLAAENASSDVPPPAANARELHVVVNFKDIKIALPQYLYSSKAAPSITVTECILDVRIMPAYLDMFVEISPVRLRVPTPAGVTVSEPQPSAGSTRGLASKPKATAETTEASPFAGYTFGGRPLSARSDGGPPPPSVPTPSAGPTRDATLGELHKYGAVAIGGLHIHTHILYGPAPAALTYGHAVQAKVGPISGELVPAHVSAVAASLAQVTFHLTDRENALAPENTIRLPPPLSLFNVSVGKVRLAVWCEGSVTELVAPAGLKLWGDSLVNPIYETKTCINVERLELASFVKSRSTPDNASPTFTQVASLDTALHFSLYSITDNWKLARDAQLAHLFAQDAATARLVFLYDDPLFEAYRRAVFPNAGTALDSLFVAEDYTKVDFTPGLYESFNTAASFHAQRTPAAAASAAATVSGPEVSSRTDVGDSSFVSEHYYEYSSNASFAAYGTHDGGGDFEVTAPLHLTSSASSLSEAQEAVESESESASTTRLASSTPRGGASASSASSLSSSWFSDRPPPLGPATSSTDSWESATRSSALRDNDGAVSDFDSDSDEEAGGSSAGVQGQPQTHARVPPIWVPPPRGSRVARDHEPAAGVRPREFVLDLRRRQLVPRGEKRRKRRARPALKSSFASLYFLAGASSTARELYGPNFWKFASLKADGLFPGSSPPEPMRPAADSAHGDSEEWSCSDSKHASPAARWARAKAQRVVSTAVVDFLSELSVFVTPAFVQVLEEISEALHPSQPALDTLFDDIQLSRTLSLVRNVAAQTQVCLACASLHVECIMGMTLIVPERAPGPRPTLPLPVEPLTEREAEYVSHLVVTNTVAMGSVEQHLHGAQFEPVLVAGSKALLTAATHIEYQDQHFGSAEVACLMGGMGLHVHARDASSLATSGIASELLLFPRRALFPVVFALEVDRVHVEGSHAAHAAPPATGAWVGELGGIGIAGVEEAPMVLNSLIAIWTTFLSQLGLSLSEHASLRKRQLQVCMRELAAASMMGIDPARVMSPSVSRARARSRAWHGRSGSVGLHPDDPRGMSRSRSRAESRGAAQADTLRGARTFEHDAGWKLVYYMRRAYRKLNSRRRRLLQTQIEARATAGGQAQDTEALFWETMEILSVWCENKSIDEQALAYSPLILNIFERLPKFASLVDSTIDISFALKALRLAVLHSRGTESQIKCSDLTGAGVASYAKSNEVDPLAVGSDSVPQLELGLRYVLRVGQVNGSALPAILRFAHFAGLQQSVIAHDALLLRASARQPGTKVLNMIEAPTLTSPSAAGGVVVDGGSSAEGDGGSNSDGGDGGRARGGDPLRSVTFADERQPVGESGGRHIRRWSKSGPDKSFLSGELLSRSHGDIIGLQTGRTSKSGDVDLEDARRRRRKRKSSHKHSKSSGSVLKSVIKRKRMAAATLDPAGSQGRKTRGLFEAMETLDRRASIPSMPSMPSLTVVDEAEAEEEQEEQEEQENDQAASLQPKVTLTVTVTASFERVSLQATTREAGNMQLELANAQVSTTQFGCDGSRAPHAAADAAERAFGKSVASAALLNSLQVRFDELAAVALEPDVQRPIMRITLRGAMVDSSTWRIDSDKASGEAVLYKSSTVVAWDGSQLITTQAPSKLVEFLQTWQGAFKASGRRRGDGGSVSGSVTGSYGTGRRSGSTVPGRLDLHRLEKLQGRFLMESAVVSEVALLLDVRDNMAVFELLPSVSSQYSISRLSVRVAQDLNGDLAFSFHVFPHAITFITELAGNENESGGEGSGDRGSADPVLDRDERLQSQLAGGGGSRAHARFALPPIRGMGSLHNEYIGEETEDGSIDDGGVPHGMLESFLTSLVVVDYVENTISPSMLNHLLFLQRTLTHEVNEVLGAYLGMGSEESTLGSTRRGSRASSSAGAFHYKVDLLLEGFRIVATSVEQPDVVLVVQNGVLDVKLRDRVVPGSLEEVFAAWQVRLQGLTVVLTAKSALAPAEQIAKLAALAYARRKRTRRKKRRRQNNSGGSGMPDDDDDGLEFGKIATNIVVRNFDDAASGNQGSSTTSEIWVSVDTTRAVLRPVAVRKAGALASEYQAAYEAYNVQRAAMDAALQDQHLEALKYKSQQAFAENELVLSNAAVHISVIDSVFRVPLIRADEVDEDDELAPQGSPAPSVFESLLPETKGAPEATPLVRLSVASVRVTANSQTLLDKVEEQGGGTGTGFQFGSLDKMLGSLLVERVEAFVFDSVAAEEPAACFNKAVARMVSANWYVVRKSSQNRGQGWINAAATGPWIDATPAVVNHVARLSELWSLEADAEDSGLDHAAGLGGATPAARARTEAATRKIIEGTEQVRSRIAGTSLGTSTVDSGSGRVREPPQPADLVFEVKASVTEGLVRLHPSRGALGSGSANTPGTAGPGWDETGAQLITLPPLETLARYSVDHNSVKRARPDGMGRYVVAWKPHAAVAAKIDIKRSNVVLTPRLATFLAEMSDRAPSVAARAASADEDKDVQDVRRSEGMATEITLLVHCEPRSVTLNCGPAADVVCKLEFAELDVLTTVLSARGQGEGEGGSEADARRRRKRRRRRRRRRKQRQKKRATGHPRIKVRVPKPSRDGSGFGYEYEYEDERELGLGIELSSVAMSGSGSLELSSDDEYSLGGLSGSSGYELGESDSASSGSEDQSEGEPATMVVSTAVKCKFVSMQIRHVYGSEDCVRFRLDALSGNEGRFYGFRTEDGGAMFMRVVDVANVLLDVNGKNLEEAVAFGESWSAGWRAGLLAASEGGREAADARDGTPAAVAAAATRSSAPSWSSVVRIREWYTSVDLGSRVGRVQVTLQSTMLETEVSGLVAGLATRLPSTLALSVERCVMAANNTIESGQLSGRVRAGGMQVKVQREYRAPGGAQGVEVPTELKVVHVQGAAVRQVDADLWFNTERMIKCEMRATYVHGRDRLVDTLDALPHILSQPAAADFRSGGYVYVDVSVLCKGLTLYASPETGRSVATIAGAVGSLVADALASGRRVRGASGDGRGGSGGVAFSLDPKQATGSAGGLGRNESASGIGVGGVDPKPADKHGIGSLHVVVQRANWLRIQAQSIQAQLVQPRVAGSYKRLLVVYVRKGEVAMQYAASRSKSVSAKTLLSSASTQPVFRIPTAHIEMDTDQAPEGGVVWYDFDSRFPSGPISVATSRAVYKHLMNIVRNFSGSAEARGDGGSDDESSDGDEWSSADEFGSRTGSKRKQQRRRRSRRGRSGSHGRGSDDDDEAAFFAASDEGFGLSSSDGEGEAATASAARFHFHPQVSAMGNVTAHMASAPNISFILSLIGVGGVDTIPSAIFGSVGEPLGAALDQTAELSAQARRVRFGE